MLPWLNKITFISPLKSLSIVPGVFKTLILFFAAKPDLGLIWISYSSGNATDNPVGTRHDSPGFNSIYLSINAIRSIPDAPLVLYDGNFTEGSNFFTKTLIIILNDQWLFQLIGLKFLIWNYI